jgi:ABC-2 type transport system permease protein
MSFSLHRFIGIAYKELIQLQRDRLTLGMIILIPLAEVFLFGYAINSEPKHLPTVVVMSDPGPAARAYVEALRVSGYFDIKGTVDERQAEALLDRGEVQFVVTIPVNFHRDLVRGLHPTVLIEADATDPMTVGSALAVQSGLRSSRSLLRDLPASTPDDTPPPFDVQVLRHYNPEVISAYNIVPGLLGVILTMTMALMTGLAMTRERERGTFENLLSTPATPFEVMTGKIVPYIGIGLVQVTLILLSARYAFEVPIVGSLWLLYGVVLLFIATTLSLGMTISSVARNQLQAMQITFFYFLPSILLSGFVFPFRGMPEWAQDVGSLLPLTHFLVLVRGILLKGAGPTLLWPHIWPLLAFMAVVLLIGLKTYRRTLD